MAHDQTANDRKSEGSVGGIGALLASLLLGAGKYADDVARFAIRYGDDVGCAVVRHSDDLTQSVMRHGDDMGRAVLCQSDDLGRLGMRHEDNLARSTGAHAVPVEAGAEQADDISLGHYFHAAKVVTDGVERCTRNDQRRR